MGDYRQFARSNVVEDAVKKLEDTSSAKVTKPTAEQSRTNIARLLNTKDVKSWPAADKAGMQQAVEGTFLTNRAQQLGNALKPDIGNVTKGGVAAGIGSSLGISNPVLLGIGAAGLGTGMAARTIANRGARNLVEDASAAVRRNSPLYQTTPILPNTIRAAPGRDAVTGAIIGRQVMPTSEPQPIRRVLPDGTIEELS